MPADLSLMCTAVGRALMLTGIFIAVGAAISTRMAPSRAIARPLRLAAVLLLLGVIAQATGQLVAFEAFADGIDSVLDTLSIISATHWGRTRSAVLALALVAFLVSFTGRFINVPTQLAALAMVALLPMTGHAAAADDLFYQYALAFVHAGAAAMWLGTLALLGPTWWIGVPATTAALPRYGRLALFVAPLVVLSGAATAWSRVASPIALADSSYGRVLLAKTAVVVFILALGGRHHIRLIRARQGVEIETMRRTLQLELLLAAIVLLLTGWLGESEPTRLH